MAVQALGAVALEGGKQATIEISRRSVEFVHYSMEQIFSSPDAQPALEALNITGQPEGMQPQVGLFNEQGVKVAEVPLEEKQLYDQAGLEMKEVNGRDVLVRSDIDPNLTDARGRTNMERMEQGLAPIDESGQGIELHHIRQNPDGPLAELTSAEHEGNFKLLHPDLENPSEIDRGEFAKVRSEHWKERAQMMKAGAA
ncbi:HNH/ENDO VII family nuclease [Paenibacillus thailandensis]|uniref:HNH/ENDO VII family nuclease n=1 Tax=Paenibacillus thailandensis TaxID=393250 RepID=A0ABW5R1Z7_9BACL